MLTGETAFIRYLEAKKAIDDRSLSPHVFDSLTKTLRVLPKNQVLRVLEAGCGIGTMVERMIERKAFIRASYCGIDLSPGCLSHAWKRLEDYSKTKGITLDGDTQGGIVLRSHSFHVKVELRAEDVMAFANMAVARKTYDLLIAHAFLDLVDLYGSLPLLLSLVSEGGLAYLTLNFDGVTSLEPTVDADLDKHVIALYHDTMDHRFLSGKQSGDSKTGRHLLPFLAENGLTILDAGGSDWVIYPTHGAYRNDDEYFLHFIVDTITAALKSCEEISPEDLHRWVATRHEQIRLGKLFYIAHQIDVLARIPRERLHQ